MRLPSTLASTTLLFALSTPAIAGGIGVEMLTGLHSETVSYYDANSTPFSEVQARPTSGLAFQAILGDRDYELLGLMRVAIFLDAGPTVDVVPPKNYVHYTDEEGEELDPVVPFTDIDGDNEPDGTALGVISAGLQWGVFGDPTGFQINVLTLLGAGILTTASTEFLLLEVGPGAHYAFSDELQAYGQLLYHLRYRKGISSGAGASVGVRYFFD